MKLDNVTVRGGRCFDAALNPERLLRKPQR